ncbi:MAG: type II 3-dehydroquinate dehydratase [Desulfosalsimonadaceae bacterium]
MDVKILVIHGPNLNMLGKREPGHYGTETMEEINRQMIQKGSQLGMEVDFYQSNCEGQIIDRIQSACDQYNGMIINPAAYTHTSLAIRDALLLLSIPVVEVHLSNIYQRESFRRHSMIADVVSGQISGFGSNGYLLAMDAVFQLLRS